ncbi:MAG: PBP1A family penicillin-binding protein [Hyphomicrobium sp.]
MGWFNRHRSRAPGERTGSGLKPPPLPQPFQALTDFAFRPALSFATNAERLAPKRGLIRRLFARLPLKYRMLILAPAVAGLGLGASLITMMVYYTVTFPHPLSMRSKERAPVIRILARDGSVLAERGAAADYMPLDLLPRHVQGAVVATEDRRFYDHYGLDPIGLVRAFFTNLRAGRFAQGGSTLTQQLAKNLFLTPDRTIARKIEELGLALWLELRLSKTDILELYLNRVYFGGGAYGIEAASQRYFDKSAREMTIAEAALIAGLLKAPSKYSPAASPGAARARSRVVLAKMLEAGVITPEDERKAIEERIVFHEPKSQRDTTGIEYAIDFVLERLPPLLGGGHAEVVVETTLDANLQRRANDIVRQALAKQGDALGVSQAAVAVLDTDGGIRALVGGRNYAESQFNRAVKARRQPGSAFKPFVYLAALESGMTPDTVTYDLPLTIEGWTPRNDNGQYTGEITLRRALSQSVNTVAVRLNQLIGRGKTVQVAHRLGVKSEMREGPSLPLGTSEVTLLEMTGAYGVFGNGGTAIEPHAIRRVRMSSGRVLFVRDVPRTEQIVDPVTVGALNDMLNAALVSGTGKRAGIANHPAAGKTGTTQDFRDAWFVGYTSHLTAGVWIGNDSGKAMNRAMGGGLPAEIWRQIMDTAHDGKAPLALPGTSRQAPGAGDALMSALPWNAPQPASRTPRVGRIIETLPWLSSGSQPAAAMPPKTSAAAPRPAATTNVTENGRIKVTPPAPAHPAERIDDDFIAQALAESGIEDAPRVAADEPAKAERPRGIMSLGGWW